MLNNQAEVYSVASTFGAEVVCAGSGRGFEVWVQLPAGVVWRVNGGYEVRGKTWGSVLERVRRGVMMQARLEQGSALHTVARGLAEVQRRQDFDACAQHARRTREVV